MPEKTSRPRKAAAPVKARSASRTIAAAAATSSRVVAKETAKAAIEAAAAAVAPRAAKPVDAAPSHKTLAAAAPAERPDMPAPVNALLLTGADQARAAYARAKATSESLRQAVAESASVTSRGVIEVNDKVIDAMRAQSDAAFELWRSTLAAGSVSEAIRVQTGGARQVYETAANHWKDVAETTGRWFAASVKPLQSVWTVQSR